MARSSKDARERLKLTPIVVPVVCVILTAAITYTLTQHNGRIRYLDYYVSSTGGMLSRPVFQDQQIKVQLGTKTIDNLSSVIVELHNNSDEDFEDVPIQIEFTGQGNAQPKLLLARSLTNPEHSTPQGEQQPQIPGKLVLRYNLKVVNRISEPAFLGNYLFEGNQAPEVSVSLLKKGVDARRTVVAPRVYSMSDFMSGLWLGIVLALLINRIGYWRGRLKARRLAKESQP